MPRDYFWKPISGLEGDGSSLTNGELGYLADVWREQRQELEDSEALKTFRVQLNRRWAIETGVIEGAYSLDRGVTETLILEGIDANRIRSSPGEKDPELVAAMIEDHLTVLEGLFEFVHGDRSLTVGYIRELHSALLRHVRTHTVRDAMGNVFQREIVKGAFKTLPNNPTRPDGSIHQYCPPEHVASEMDNLIRMHEEHARRKLPVEVQVAWLHHAFTQIHPFADGNGRVARAIASAVFIKAGLFPLLVTRDDQTYIPALERADAGDLSEFVRLMVSRQRRAVVDAIHAIPPVSQPRTVEEQIEAVRLKMVWEGQIKVENPAWRIAREIADRVVSIANRRLTEVGELLTGQFGQAGWIFHVQGPVIRFVSPGNGLTVALQIAPPREQFRGVLLAKMTLLESNAILTGEEFQINYKEPSESALARFRPWFEAGLANGLARWRELI